MYKVSEVAKNAGVTVAGVYKAIKQLDKQYINKIDKVTYINEDGYKILIQRFTENKSNNPSTKTDENIVSSLLKQLEEKDRQISEKDKQISLLMEQARNYQILLKTEQDKIALPLPKQGLLARLFGKTDRTIDKD